MGQFTKVSFHVLNTGLGFDSILSNHMILFLPKKAETLQILVSV